MIDSGADRDVVSEKTISRLNIGTNETDLRVVTVDNELISKRMLASFTIESLNEEYRADVNDALVGKILTGENDVPPHRRDLSACAHLSGVNFDKVDEDVEMIIGAAHYDACVPIEVRRGERQNGIVGIRCRLGWTVAGRLGRRDPDDVSINAISADNEALRQSLDRIFYHDFAIVSEEELGDSKEHKEAIDQLAKSIRFDEKVGKYFVGLPWKIPREEVTKLFKTINSRETAMRRLRSMIPRLVRDPARKERVFAEMKKFVDTGVAVEIDSINDDSSATKPRWYLPIHVVEKRGKTRVCHDARASTGGYCLNDFLLGGPNIINSLAEILMNARKWKYVLMNDIRAFFHQVRVDERDVDVFRFPWFADETMRFAILLAFLAHIFGSGASSIVTAYVLRHHAEVIKPLFSYAVYDWIRRRFYVDDGIDGANTAQGLMELSDGVVKAMKMGGFELCKFKSNLPQLMEGCAEAEVKLGDKDKDDDAPTKVLGVSWIPSADVFTFNFDPEISRRDVNTPRELISVQSSLYDPLGFISPFQLLGRRMLQRCAPQKNGWDNPLDPKLRKDFEKWARSIPSLAKLRLPRWWNCGVENVASAELHVFVDAAATSGYGAAAYRRVIGQDGTVKVILLCSRSHVVPLNPSRASHHNSTPRLELTSAEKGVEVRQFVIRATETTFDRIIMWTDSEASLKMINDTTSRFKLFFANRLSKIHAASSVKEWRHVDSANNPADCTSRGIDADDEEKWKFFHYGPKFLYRPEEEWPKTILSHVHSVNVLATVVSTPEVSTFFVDAISRTSSWYWMRRRVAVLRLAARRWRASTKAKTREARANLPTLASIKKEQLEEAEKDIIREVQRSQFGQEIDDLLQQNVRHPTSRGNVKPKSASLRPHNPFLDNDGILRVGSRLINANIAYEQKFPIILPPKHTVVLSILRSIHSSLIHAGPKQVLTQTRQKYWVNKGLQASKSVVNSCVDCQRRFKLPLKQKMAELPTFRVNAASPFEKSALDLAGPFDVKMNGRSTHKVWVVIFTCCVTRSIHVEIVYKMDANALINAITRFTSRRPGVTSFISDRGTNLIGADRILRQEMELWRNSSVNALAEKGLEWSFIPAGTPSYGGVWERCVGLLKRHLVSATKGDVLHVDTFNTIIIEIEGILNRRPLTPMSTDPSDTEAITPAHILYPSTFAHSSTTIVPPNGDASAFRNSWKQAQSRINAFWKIWSTEYLALLHARSKWRQTKRDLKEGDLVILVDESVKRNDWRMARVLSTEGSGNHVRRAKVKRSDGKILLKDRTKLVHLEIDDEKKDNIQ